MLSVKRLIKHLCFYDEATLIVCTLKGCKSLSAMVFLQDAYIPKDPATGKQAHRGFGFVTFASAEDVDKVMSCAHTIHNQELAVQCAIPKVDTFQQRTPKLWSSMVSLACALAL